MCKAAYLHVPFCQDICAYCDFFRCRYHVGLAEKWLAAIAKELTIKKLSPLTTMYIGGGTPSALQPQQLETLLSLLVPYTKEVNEYTIEANVESLTDEKLDICQRYGVNRISLGVQSLQPSLLNQMHRHHTSEDVLACIKRIHAHGIHNISIDMIYGLPKQSLAMWEEDLHTIVSSFPIQHISLYGLTIEPHSKFGRQGIQNIDEDIEADMYDLAITLLQQYGFQQYEISNFAKPKYASLHNQVYWRYEDFYGIGCGASGKDKRGRYENTSNLETYLQQGASSVYEKLDTKAQMFEMIMMSLRMKQGISRQAFFERFGKDISEVYGSIIEKQKEKGLLLVDEEKIWASERGFHLLNDVLVEFLGDDKAHG